MKRLAQLVFLVVCALALGLVAYYLIQGRSGAAAAARPVLTRQIVPSSSQSPSKAAASGSDSEAESPVPALQNEVILNITSINDQEEGEEKFLTVRYTDRNDGRLSIVLVASGARVWEGDTLSTKLTTFSIQARDLIGDHSLELVCTGMDDSGGQTIDVFRRVTSSGAAGGAQSGPRFEPILSLTADSIVIGETERGESYQLGQTSAESWPIFAYSRDNESANVLDQVKDKYAWDAKAGRYAKTASQRISGAQVEYETISKILTGSEADFETFLQGVWYETDKSPLDPSARLLLFDKDAGSISFYKADVQEIFLWTDSHATRNGIYIRSHNESVEDLVRLVNIELSGSDQIALQVYEDVQMKAEPEDRWDGSYRKMSRDPPKEATSDSPKQGTGASEKTGARYAGRGLRQAAFKLEGPYRSAGGNEISFALTRYSLKSTTGSSETGGFELFALGDATVLELVANGQDGLPAARKTYKATYSESKIGKDLVRRLILSPAKTAIDGLELLREEDLFFEQRVKG